MKQSLKILIYDIETAPNLGYIWGKYEQDVIRYESEWYIMCFAYKWLGERSTHVIALPDFPKFYSKYPENDLGVVKELHRLFSEADVVIAHNGNSFDQKKSQARMAYHGFKPPEPYRQIDTKLVSRKYFSFNSNKLDDLGELLGCGRKIQTGGFDLWYGCMRGDKKSWNKMKRYNKQDVVLLEKIYLKLLPWINNHPAMNVLGELDSCPKCGHGPMQRRGKQINKSNFYWRYQCQRCGGWSRQRLVEKDKNKVAYVN